MLCFLRERIILQEFVLSLLSWEKGDIDVGWAVYGRVGVSMEEKEVHRH